MGQIESAAMDRLLAPLKEDQQTERSSVLKRQLVARAKRKASADFDIRQAMAKGDLQGVHKIQDTAARADELDKGELQGIADAHSVDLTQAAAREREHWDQFTDHRGPGGYGGDGVKRAADVHILPANLAALRPGPGQLVDDAKTRARGAGQPWTPKDDLYAASALGSQKGVDSARATIATNNRAAFDLEMQNANADEANAYRAGQVPQAVRETRAVGQQYANQRDQAALKRVPTVPRVVNGNIVGADVNETLSRGGVITRGGQSFRSRGGKLSPFDPPPPTGPKRQPVAY